MSHILESDSLRRKSYGCLFTAQGAPGFGTLPGPSVIPNGQPPQWNQPPTFPHAAKPRQPPVGSSVATSVNSNGTPTPPSYSHPGLLIIASNSLNLSYDTNSTSVSRNVWIVKQNIEMENKKRVVVEIVVN